MSKEKLFPITDGPSVSWELLLPYESQALKNHYQTLEELAKRGGLDAAEAWAIVNSMKWQEAKKRWGYDKMRVLWMEWVTTNNGYKRKYEEAEGKLVRIGEEVKKGGSALDRIIAIEEILKGERT